MIYDSDCIKEKAASLAVQNACGVSIDEKRDVYKFTVWCLFEQHALVASMIEDVGYVHFSVNKVANSFSDFEEKMQNALAKSRANSRLTITPKD